MTVKKRLLWVVMWPYSKYRRIMPWYVILPRLFLVLFLVPALAVEYVCSWLSDRIPEPRDKDFPPDYFK